MLSLKAYLQEFSQSLKQKIKKCYRKSELLDTEIESRETLLCTWHFLGSLELF